MAAKVGRCGNELFCSIASAGEDVPVRDGEAFVCPKCGKALFDAPPAQGGTAHRSALIAVAVVTLAAGGFIIGRGLVVGAPPPAPAAPPVAERQPPRTLAPLPVAPPVVAPAAVAVPAVAPAVVAPATAATPPAAAIQAAAAPPLASATRQAAAPKQPRAAPAAPPPLPRVAAAPATPPASARTAPPKPPAALSSTAPPGRQTPPPQVAAPPAIPPPVTAAAAPAAAKIQVAMITPAAHPPAEAAAPHGADRPFHPVPIAGGAPDYPDAYADEGRSGAVTISCTIQASGFPAGCHVLGVQGGGAFSGAVLKWLGSGRVRYAPILRDGQPIAETHQWSVTFAPQ